MASNLFDLRFLVQRDDGYCSSQWRLWVTRAGDVYLATRGMGGIQKYSFHASGICRSAFTREHGAPRTMADRAIVKWNRATTPRPGSGSASRVAWIAFPTDYLSRSPLPVAKSTVIAAAPQGRATYVEVGYTFESESFVLEAFGGNRRLHSFNRLPSGEAVFLESYHGEWENNDLSSPPAPDSVLPELCFSASDPQNTGRPLRIILGPTPRDGDALVLQELGGYKVSR